MRSHVPACAGGLACALSIAAAEPAAAQVSLSLSDASPVVGQRVIASGRAEPAAAGLAARLEHRAGAAWRPLASATVTASGRFRLRGRVVRSGALRVSVGERVSAERRVRVRARVGVGARRLQVTAGRRATVRGTVRPGVAGLPVRLEVRRSARWTATDTSRTRARGAYALSDRRRATMSAPVRVRVSARPAGVASATRRLGRLEVYRSAAASWYGPGLYGNPLGCGGRLGPGTLGVAHKSLPCGTRVTFRRGRRSVRVAVIDRGPFVGGREYDLTAATASRLGFRGHGSVLATR